MESQIDTSSYIFSSLQNTATQGFPIPLVYGELRVGSNIVSTNVVSEDMSRKT
jgi:predicted phage tail protein